MKKHLRFLKALPRVKPYFPVKCNGSDGVLRLLAELGAGFACTNKVGSREDISGWASFGCLWASGRAYPPVPRLHSPDGVSRGRSLPLLPKPSRHSPETPVLFGGSGLSPLPDIPLAGTGVLAGREGTSLGCHCHSRPTLGGFKAEPKASCSLLLLICDSQVSREEQKLNHLLVRN